MAQSRQLEGHIRIADLRHRIVIKRIISSSANALGHKTHTTSATTVQARIRQPRQMDESTLVDKETQVKTTEIVIRYISPLTITDWIEYDGKKYDIISIDDTRYPNRFLIIKSKAVV